MRKKKLKFMVLEDAYDSPKSIAVCWNKLPSEITENLGEEYYHNILSIDSEGELKKKTVIYLKSVSRFKKDIKTYENTEENVVIGYDLF